VKALAGKVALVSGGGWNLGRAVALRFAREGARVGVVGRRAELLDGTVAAIEAEGGTALALPADLTVWESALEVNARMEERFGPVDVLAALAGGGGTNEPFIECDPERWARILDVNVLCTFHAARAVVPGMVARGRGTLITCGGGGSSFPILDLPHTAYATAKAAIGRFTDQLAVELLPHGVRVNCLLPGAVPADGDEENREAAAELAAWLASDASAPLSGRIVPTSEAWWRDPARVTEVQRSPHAACLRRQIP